MDSITTTPGQPADPDVIRRQLSLGVQINLGAREWLGHTDGVQFRIGAGRPNRKVIIKLNGDDLYDIEIGHIKRRALEWVIDYQALGVDAANLGETLIRAHHTVCYGTPAGA